MLVEGGRRRSERDWSAESSHGVVDAVNALEAAATLVVRVGGRFDVEYTPTPSLHLAGTVAGGDLARWLVSIVIDEAVSASVVPAPGHELAEPGRARQLQLEGAPFAGAAPSWDVVLRNAAGLQRDTTLSGVPALPAWPPAAHLTLVDATAQFRATDVFGRAPDGTVAVWGDGLQGDSTTTMQAWGAVAGQLVLQHDTGLAGRVVASADANGDGADDLLYQNGGTVRWLVTRSSGRFPDSLGASVRAERALGFYQLDDDAPFEALLSSSDSLLLFDDARQGKPARLQTLVNPSAAGFNVFGADAAVGDLDGDGRIEIACGDAEGALVVFERNPSGQYGLQWRGDSDGVYAYDFSALPGGGFLTGRQNTADVTGDGFATAAYEFRAYVPQGSEFVPGEVWRFLAPENDLRAGSQVVVSPATSVPYLALVRGGDLYLVRGASGAREPEAYLAGAAGEPPVLADLDGDGGLDVVLRTPTGAQWMRLDEAWRGPHALGAEPLSMTRVRLDWDPGDADSVRVVRRQSEQATAVLGTTAASTWIDSTLVPGTTYEYRIDGLRAGGPGGTSNAVAIRARGLPRLLGAEAITTRSLRVQSSNPLGDDALQPRHWRLETSWLPNPVVAQVTLSAAGREATLFFAPVSSAAMPLACGAVVLYADSLRDDQSARFVGAAAQVAFEIRCPASPFYVSRAQIQNDRILVEFVRDPDQATLTPARFTLQWRGEPVPIASVQAHPGSASVELVPAPGVAFVGRGVPYLLRLDAGIRAAGDGAPLADAGTELTLRVDGRGPAFVFPYPNPVREGDSVVFGETSVSTRVEIFDLEGQRVRSLGSSVGGGIEWNLRNAMGDKVVPGAYLYVARDATGTHSGRLVVLR
jgi:hypothetical protein